MKRTIVAGTLSAPHGAPSPKSRAFSLSRVTWRFPKPRILHGVGLAGGLSGGLLGIGGGSVIAPLLLATGGLRPAQVSGTTLATVLMISLVGTSAYATLGHLNLGMAWPVAVGSITGSVIGALLARRLSLRMMLACFLIVLPYFALKELFPSLVAPSLPPSYMILVALGFSTGLLSGLLGISGASLVVPSLVAFFLIDHHAAQGIAISVALADSAAGTLTHARGKNVSYSVVMAMAVPAVVAAVGGALISNILPSWALRYLFVLFMGAVWGMLMLRLISWYRLSRPLAVSHAVASGDGPSAVPVRRAPMGDPRPRPDWWRYARRYLNTGNLMTAMLVFVPLSFISHQMHASPVAVFGCAALSCVALSYRLGQATEVLGSRLGPVAGGLLNATFGNAAELIISIAALNQGLYIVVRTSLIGSIVGQLLLVLGTSLLLAGLRHRNLKFNRSLVQVNFTLMMLALVVIGLPSVVAALGTHDEGKGVGLLAPILSGILLIIYASAVAFSLRRQPDEEDTGGGKDWTIKAGLVVLGVSTAGIVFISDYLVESIIPFVESTGISEVFVGLILIPIFSNVVDHIVAISVAMKNRMDLSLTISVGSAAQVACLVLPAIVIVSSLMGRSAALVFAPIELVSLAAGLALIVPVLLDGESNWLEGAQLLACYVILGVVLGTI